MFYAPIEIKGEIRNLKPSPLAEEWFTYEIFLDGQLVYANETKGCNREEAISNALIVGNELKRQELHRRELATVGNSIYVKYSTDVSKSAIDRGITGYYGIFYKGDPYCYSADVDRYTKETALAALKKLPSHKKW